VKPREISETITHLAFYSGWANSVSAVAVAKDVFAARKINIDQLPRASPRLLLLDEAAEAQRASRVGEQFGKAAPGVSCSTRPTFCSATSGRVRTSCRATEVS
jgi:4-carboxymuconolactone decarboxylase